jgi:hypothetical protein
MVSKLIRMRPATYAGGRRAGGASENESQPKQEPSGTDRGGGHRTAALVPFRPSTRPGGGVPDWDDPDRLLRWIMAAVVVIGIGTACGVIIALLISFG